MMGAFNAADYLFTGEQADEYYAALHTKHFTADATGSVFTDPAVASLADLLAVAAAQRGNRDGDDRHLFDAVEVALRDGVSYLRVNVGGLTGATTAGDLPPDTALHVRTTKPGVPPDFVAHGQRLPTDHATIVMTEDRNSGRRVVLTAHPGSPAAPAAAHRTAHPDGTVLRAGDVAADETVLLDPHLRTITTPRRAPAAPTRSAQR